MPVPPPTTDHFSDGFLDAVREARTPVYAVDEGALQHNLAILDQVQKAAGVTILAALKGFALWHTFPLLRQYLAGACASGPHEARLAREKLDGEVHAYAPAFSEADIAELLPLCDHLVFNSPRQVQTFAPGIRKQRPNLQLGLRINPQHSEGEVALYDPCAPGSRLGTPPDQLDEATLRHLSGLHFHTLCEQNVDPFERTLAVFEERCAPWLRQLRWVNFGGGHHITRQDYQRERLVEILRAFRERHPHLKVYLEPGEAVALNTGVLATSVLDIVDNNQRILILDTSATAHMPDILEMPYRPEITGAGLPGEKAHTCTLGGLTCLAGDVIGEYSFSHEPQIGQRLIFLDMAHYTMVKNTTFNGVALPDIAIYRNGQLDVVRHFEYEDYRNRLG